MKVKSHTLLRTPFVAGIVSLAFIPNVLHQSDIVTLVEIREAGRTLVSLSEAGSKFTHGVGSFVESLRLSETIDSAIEGTRSRLHEAEVDQEWKAASESFEGPGLVPTRKFWFTPRH